MNLVVGATGVLGMEICKRLRERGASVRGLVRSGSSKESELASMGVEIVYGDLKEPPTINKACRGVKCVISSANSMMSRRRGDSFKTVDRDGHLGLIAAAEKAGAEHFIYISVSPNSPDCAFFNCKRRVEKALRGGSIAWTVLQAAAFMEIFFSARGGWNLEKGKVVMIGPGLTPTCFVSLHDVAEFAVMATENPKMRDRAIPVGGPQALTATDAVKVFEDVKGEPLKVKRVPVILLRTVGFLVSPFSERASMILSVIGNESPDVIDMGSVISEFPVKLTSLRDFAGRSLTARRV